LLRRRVSNAQYGWRVLNLRMLAICDLSPPASGPLTGAFGYPATATGYGVFGVIATPLVGDAALSREN
jgi:hypothetical protein